MQIRQALVDIQYGRADDTFGWMHQRLPDDSPGCTSTGQR